MECLTLTVSRARILGECLNHFRFLCIKIFSESRYAAAKQESQRRKQELLLSCGHPTEDEGQKMLKAKDIASTEAVNLNN